MLFLTYFETRTLNPSSLRLDRGDTTEVFFWLPVLLLCRGLLLGIKQTVQLRAPSSRNFNPCASDHTLRLASLMFSLDRSLWLVSDPCE